MYPRAEQAAAAVAVMLKRSGQSRARISSLTIRKVAGRKDLRSAFKLKLRDALEDGYGWLLVELSSGGFGAVQVKALEAAKPITGKKHLTSDERTALTRGTANYDVFHSEVAEEEEEEEDTEEGE